jgi:hypothetical protein
MADDQCKRPKFGKSQGTENFDMSVPSIGPSDIIDDSMSSHRANLVKLMNAGVLNLSQPQEAIAITDSFPIGTAPGQLSNLWGILSSEQTPQACFVRVPIIHDNCLPDPFCADNQHDADLYTTLHVLALVDSSVSVFNTKIVKGTPIKVLFTDKNLAYAKIVSTSSPLDIAIEYLGSASDMFNNAFGYIMGDQPLLSNPPALDEALDKIGCYDDLNIPNKEQHSRILGGLDTSFQAYVKLFICKCWESGVTIQLNSGKRSAEKQQKLYDEWVAGGKQGIEPARNSHHLRGSAIDFNPTLKDGTVLKSTDSKSKWLASGIPNIGKSFGMRWGGDFKTNYDPIHFDYPNLPTEEPTSQYGESIATSQDPYATSEAG